MDTFSNRGKNITRLQAALLEDIDSEDTTRLMDKISRLMEELPDPNISFVPKQGLILGLVQSGKTVALTTAIAMAADNGYKLFIVLTTDNIWLYEQTADRLKGYLQGLHIEGKQEWDGQGQMWTQENIKPAGAGVILVTTKNTKVLRSLISAITNLKYLNGDELPPAIIIDDEADQASLDTKNSKRAKNPNVEQGPTNKLIGELRNLFSKHVFLQVTATPQALFLQDTDSAYRPEFTVLIEPGKGYIGGNTFFSLDTELAENLIRHIDQNELDELLLPSSTDVPSSLKVALCTFFVGSTIKYLINESIRQEGRLLDYTKDPKYSFLCHISQKKSDHIKAFNAINSFYQSIVNTLHSPVENEITVKLKEAYNDVISTLKNTEKIPSFDDVLKELKNFMSGTEVQVLNSDREMKQPKYDRRYNILIGGNKLSRGVTIKNLITTYYGRSAKSPNMDTVLQHARMYGYREKFLDITRVFLTPEVEQRFRLINESEQGLRSVIEQFPGKKYKGIKIGRGTKATRSNVLNPNNIGSFSAGRSYFPIKPLSLEKDIKETTEIIDKKIESIIPNNQNNDVATSIDTLIDLIKLTKSDSRAGGLWDNERIIASLQELKDAYGNLGHLVVRYGRNLRRNDDGKLRAVLGGDKSDESHANPNHPTLFMFRLTGEKWDKYPFWVPVLRFPDGQYAIMFNVD